MWHLTDPPEGRLRFELHYSGGQPESFFSNLNAIRVRLGLHIFICMYVYV